ncbi:carboxymuconolactone decarboxylase family protein [Pseudonocardia ailaonensis]|uniref:Carboxymuconolactone decarboxylase family protein n=1 Tax=Pseudonocardia ailaonensis TaxID=367279 RepID=A0ABN2MGE8_9PSEU
MTHDEHTGGRRFGDLAAEDMDPAQRAVNDRLVEYLHPDRAGTGAVIGGPMAALLRSPDLADGVGRLVPLLFEGLSVPRAATEVAVLLTARHWNCDFEFDTHRRYAARYGLAPDVVEAIAHGVRPQLTGELADTHDFVVRLLRDGDVDDATFATVADRWGHRGAVELITAVGFYTTLALVLNVDRYPAPALPAPETATRG